MGPSEAIVTVEQPPPATADGGRLFQEFFQRSPRSAQLLAPDGRTVAVNPAWEKLWGMTLSDLASYSVRDDPQLREKRVGALLERAFNGEAVEIPAVEYLLGFGPAAGESRWIQATATPLFDERGAVANVVLIHEDVTESISTTMRLARTGELLEESQRSARVGTWEWDVRGGGLTWTDEMRRVYGIGPEAALSYARFFELVHPDDRAALSDSIDRVRRSGGDFALDHRVVRPDGAVRWLHARGRAVMDESGALIRMIGTGQDVTERVEAEQARTRLLAAQRALAEAGRAFAEAETSVSALLDAAARHASEAVGDGCTVWLLDAGGQRLEPAVAFHPDPDVRSFARSYMSQVIPTGSDGMVARVAISGTPLFMPALDPDAIRERVNPAYRDLLGQFPAYGLMAAPMRAHGAMLGVIGVSRSTPDRPYVRDDLALLQEFADRAALAIANARLFRDAQAAEKRYRALFEGVADAILIADGERRLVDFNHAAVAMLGYSSVELRSLRADDIVLSDSSWARGEFERYLATGRWQGELELRRKDGAVLPVEVVATFVQLDDGPVLLSAVRDISDRKRAERLQRDVLAMVSHDLRGPLTILRANAQILERRQEYRASTVSAIIASTDRMARLIDDLADVVRLEAGQLSLQRRRVDLAVLVREHAEHARESGDNVTIHVETTDAPVIGNWDPDRLLQVLQNLVGNAIKHGGGGVTIRVEANDEEARFVVIDRGPGIASEHLPRLFERFYRADVSGAGGLGLGLYISRMLIEAHGGRIWAESEPGQGSVFSAALPFDHGGNEPGGL
jgi:PAS domain S-box-containing protein